jgi:mannose-6-phosphate isomerase-like protein (cupin superfamily)
MKNVFNKLDPTQVSFGSLKTKLFTYKELEVLLNLRPFTNSTRFIPCSLIKHHYWKNNCWATDENCWPIHLIKMFVDKYACYIRDASRANFKINEVAKKLEEVFKRCVDCHIYFSLCKKAKHFKKHKDISHNLIVVSEGALRVEVFSNKKYTKILKTGDYVFIPAQVYHKLIPLTNKRISCSFPITLIESDTREEREWLKV